MKPQDVIHHYLGHKVLCSDFEFIGESTADVIAIIDSVQRECVTFVTDDGVGVGDYYFDNPEFNIKPILRKLSDMTEDEAIDLVKFNSLRHNEIEILGIEDKKIWYIDGEKWHGDGVSEVIDKNIIHNELNPEQFAYLLKRGFDLFGLIPAGLAIDKTSLI